MASNDKLHQYGAYQKACELFDFVVADVAPLAKNPLWSRIAGQQISSADSIGANIEEGYGRRSRADYVRFLVIARGSATETRGRYEQRLKHCLTSETISSRVALCEEIVAILRATIRRLRPGE